jgi:Domain of unknown function (DUF3291)
VHVAQFNISKERFPLGHPAMCDFVDHLAVVNGLADQAEGFVWRLHDESGNATSMRIFEDKTIIFNLSVWESVEALKEFAFKSAHAMMLRNRRKWFDRVSEQTYVLWWVRPGGHPSIEAAKERLRYIQEHGPSPYAFTFDSVPAPAEIDA